MTVIIVLITIFVGALLAFVLWRYNAKRNPTPGTVSHNSMLEAAWTALPVLILVGIFIPSLRLVYYEDRACPRRGHDHQGHRPSMVLGIHLSGCRGMHFDSYMINDEDLKTDAEGRCVTAVDNQLVLPAGKNIRILTTSADVIHSFFIPSAGCAALRHSRPHDRNLGARGCAR